MAIAGAGVAVLLLLVAAGAFLWWRRGKRGIEKAQQEQETHSSLDSRQMESGGLETPMGSSGAQVTDLKSIGEARGAVLSVKLDQVSSRELHACMHAHACRRHVTSRCCP